MAEYNNLYQNVFYYDIVFDRDVSQEVDFITAVYHYYTGGELQAVLDVACGPGYHARAFARRNHRAIGLDLNPEMLALAREKDAAEGLTLTWVLTDMRLFQLDMPVDVVFSMFDGIDALVTNEDIVQHFQAVAHNLTPSGLYVIDIAHPRDYFLGDCSFGHYAPLCFSGQRNGVNVKITWGTNRPICDLVTNTVYVETEMFVNDHGQELIIHDSAHERVFMPQEICLLAEQSSTMQVIGWYGDFDLHRPLDNSPASRRMIAVLQKKG